MQFSFIMLTMYWGCFEMLESFKTIGKWTLSTACALFFRVKIVNGLVCFSFPLSLFFSPSVYFDVGRNEHTVRRLSSLCFSYIGRALWNGCGLSYAILIRYVVFGRRVCVYMDSVSYGIFLNGFHFNVDNNCVTEHVNYVSLLFLGD